MLFADGVFWDCAESHAPGLIRKIMARGLPPGVLMNLNFPACEPSQVLGVALRGRAAASRN